jgi:hypothetical protein
MRTSAPSLTGKFAAAILAATVLLAMGCSKTTTPSPSQNAATPAPAAQPAAPPEPVTAKTAFAPMYKAAYGWAPDVLLIRITAKQVPGFTNADGKAAMWEAIFASPGKGIYRAYSWAIASAPPDIYKGVDAGAELPWHGITHDAMPIDLALFTVDSDAAYQAAAKAAAAWLKKNPGQPLSALEIGDTTRVHAPVWYVRWGTEKSGYVVLVDASSGHILKLR